MAKKKAKSTHIDGVFREYLPQTFVPPPSLLAEWEVPATEEITPSQRQRPLLGYLLGALAILALQIAVIYFLMKSAGQL